MGACGTKEKTFVHLQSFKNSFRVFTQSTPQNLHFHEILINFQQTSQCLVTNQQSQAEPILNEAYTITFKKKKSQIDIPEYSIDKTFETVLRKFSRQKTANISITLSKKSRMIINNLFRSIIRTILIMDLKELISNIKSLHISWGLSNDQYQKMITQIKKDLLLIVKNDP